MMHLQSQTDSHSCLAPANAQLNTVHICMTTFLLNDVYKEHHEKHNAGYYPDAAKRLNNFLSPLQCSLIQCQTDSWDLYN